MTKFPNSNYQINLIKKLKKKLQDIKFLPLICKFNQTKSAMKLYQQFYNILQFFKIYKHLNVLVNTLFGGLLQ